MKTSEQVKSQDSTPGAGSSSFLSRPTRPFSSPEASAPGIDTQMANAQRMGNTFGQTAVQKQENNTGMPDDVKTKMESAHNADFSNVKVHANSSRAPAVGALAYTQGNEIHFAPGHYNPGSSTGKKLLGHELAHVVQQRQGRVKPTTQVKGLPVNDSRHLENEAETMGAKAV